MTVSEGIERAYSERVDLLVVALTGRTGSGCTSAAAALSSPYEKLSLAIPEIAEPDRRKISIVDNYLKKQWVPFKIVTVSTVIFSFMLDEDSADLEHFLKGKGFNNSEVEKLLALVSKLKSAPEFSSYKSCVGTGDRSAHGAWEFYLKDLSPSIAALKRICKTKYAPLFQCLGDNIRISGSCLSTSIDPQQIFTLIRRVKRLAKAAFEHERRSPSGSTRIVIDAIRNPLELVYLRDQFAAFYALAITTGDEDRIARLEHDGLSKHDVSEIDGKEYPRSKSLKDYGSFVSQNIQECIQKSDIFVANPGRPAERLQNITHLNAQIARYVALMLRPGLVTPTRDERCMQLAFVAKLNSGCISRQVGAVVADSSYSVKALGWNDVPKGQTPCLLRDVGKLLSGNDREAFSYFEKTDSKIKDHLSNSFLNRDSLAEKSGLPCPFCFKDAYNAIENEKNQVHTRSLHAEENAFLQLAKSGSSGIEFGVLYTTASPCELCSKKAFQLGIREVVYVDPYPGISASHVLRSGDAGLQPQLRLFGGAVGHAYHRLYEPMLPIKDEYAARLEDAQLR